MEEALPSFFAQPFSSIPVIVLKAIHQSLRSGLVFMGWTYATSFIRFTYEHLPPNSDPDSTTCLDTGCGVTFVNKN